MISRSKEIGKEHRVFIGFLLVTMMLMAGAIIWIYHVKVLNAPKVYSDGFGYYAYLPAILHGDFSFGFVQDMEHPLDLTAVDGGTVNKYPVGVAILESPFFFAAHILALLRDSLTGSCTATGYSNIYQYFVLFGGVVYWGIGTVLLYGLLCTYLGVSKKTACLTCFFITYGTNLFHYASYDSGFSHIYSYAVLTLFLYYLCYYEKRDLENRNTVWHTCVFGILAGLIFMIRNVNLLFVFTYILYGVTDVSALKKRIVTVLRPARAVPIIAASVVTILPQLLYWHYATGGKHWVLYSYGGNEKFYWTHPELLDFLFSVRKGLFFWSPILLVSVLGIILTYKAKDALYFGRNLFLILILYISGSWWCWYYGGSYGQRVAVDFMCVFAVPMAKLLERAAGGREERPRGGKPGRMLYAGRIVYGYCTVCVVWNCICMLGYWYHTIPSDGTTWRDIAALLGGG